MRDPTPLPAECKGQAKASPDKPTNTQGSRKDWQTKLLKSGLPLENDVAHVLDGLGFEVCGEYPYMRVGEAGIEVEHSVDLSAFELFDDRRGRAWGSLTLLVECKYNQQGVEWVFSPHPSDRSLIIGVTSVHQDLCTRQVMDTGPLESLERRYTHCTKGVVLHAKDSDACLIRHGLSQIRYGVPQLLVSEYVSQAYGLNDEDLHTFLFCPILVTNAPRFILHHDANVDAVSNSAVLGEVADRVEGLIVDQNPGPDLSAHVDRIYGAMVRSWPGTEHRLADIDRILKQSDPSVLHEPEGLKYRMLEATHKVLVVGLGRLRETVDQLKGAIKVTGLSLKRIAWLRKDEGGQTRIEPANTTRDYR